MAFDGTEGGEISLKLGVSMTASYRRAYPNSTQAHFFGKDILNEILAQEDCMGIRMYYGIDENGAKQLVLVGADSHENDITELVADLSFPCPNVCDTNSALNG